MKLYHLSPDLSTQMQSQPSGSPQRQKKDALWTVAIATAQDERLPLCGKASQRRFRFVLILTLTDGRCSRELVAIHETERLATTPKKGRPSDVLFLAQKTRFELVLRFSHTTPLAGEPLEPLGYFCNGSITFFLFKSYTTIPHFFGVVKAFYAKNTKKFLFLFFPLSFPRRKSFLRKYSQILDGFSAIVYNEIVEK